MRSSNFPFCLTLVTLVVVFFAAGVHGGSEYFNCPGTNPTFPPGVPCDYDCITNHAALNGTCVLDANNVDTNCICVDSGSHPYSGSCTYVNNNVQIPAGCQCAYNTTGLAPLYAAVCELDCKCSHGGRGGTCNWAGRACICDYNFPVGQSWSSTDCDIQALITAEQAIATALNMLG